MSTILKYSFGAVVAGLLIGYFLDIVFLFGLFSGFSSLIFHLFVCVGAESSVAEIVSTAIMGEILFFLIYKVYSSFLK